MMNDNKDSFKAESTPVQNVVTIGQMKQPDVADVKSSSGEVNRDAGAAKATNANAANVDAAKKQGGLPENSAAAENWDADKTEFLTGFEDTNTARAWLVDAQGNTHEMNSFPFVIGRGDGCDLIPKGRGISRRHIEIALQSGRFVVSDLDSLNGLKVNNYQVSRVILEDNDDISIGDCTLTFHFHQPGEDEIDDDELKAGLSAFPFLHKSGLLKTANSNVRFNLKTAGMALLVLLLGTVLVQSFLSTPSGSDVAMIPAATDPAVNQTQTGRANAPAQKNPADVAAQIDKSVNGSAIGQVQRDGDLKKSLDLAQMSPPEKPQEKVVKPRAVDDATKRKIAADKQRRLNVSKANQAATKKLGNMDDLYIQGNAQLVISELTGIVDSSLVAKDIRAKAKRKLETIKGLYDQYSRGLVAFNNNDKETAFTEWTNFLNEEKNVYRKERSIYAIDVSTKAVNEYLAKAKAEQAAGNHRDAYNLWVSAVKLNGSTEAKLALSAVDSKVRSLYRKGLKYEYVNSEKAKALWSEILTLVPASNEYYTKANAKLSWYRRWGVE